MFGAEHGGPALHAWIALFGALGLFCLLQGGFWLLRARVQRRGEQLGRLLRGQQSADAPEGRIKLRRAVSDERGAVERLRARLEKWGITSLSRLLARSAALVLGVGLLAGLLTGSVAGGLGVGAFAVLAVYGYLASRRARALERMRSQVPRALELMTFSLRAGNSLEEAVRVAAEEVDPPLALELQRCHQESEMGRPIETTLEQMRGRWPEVGALRFFVESVSVLKRTGGNLVEVMEQIGANLRAQAAFAARHRALTAEGRMSGRILMALPFLALGIEALTAPEQLQLMFESAAGRTVLVLAGLSWAVGSLWVARLTRPR